MRSTRSYSGQHVVEGVVHRGLLLRVERVHLNPPKRRMGGGVVRLPPIPISRVIQRMSANVDDARLGRRLGWRFRLCRKLKHRCLLTLMQVRQENKRAIWKFECVVMHLWYVLVDLSKDRRCGILRRGNPTCTGDEVVGRKLVTDLCGA